MLKKDIKKSGILTVEEWVSFVEYEKFTISNLKTILEETKQDINNGKYVDVPNLKESMKNFAEALITIIYKGKEV